MLFLTSLPQDPPRQDLPVAQRESIDNKDAYQDLCSEHFDQ